MPGKSPVKVQPKIPDIFLEELYSYELFMLSGGGPLGVVIVTWTDLDLLAFILHVFSQFWVAVRLVCSFSEALTGLLSVTCTAAASVKVVVDFGVFGRSAWYSRYNNGFRTLP
jgi:hypothetical protein